MGLRWEEAKKYLHTNNVKIGRAAWFNVKKKLEEKTINVLFATAKEFHSRHLNRVNILRYLLDESFYNLEHETDYLKRQHIINSIKELQYDIATFDEATRDLIEEGKKGIPIPEQKIGK